MSILTRNHEGNLLGFMAARRADYWKAKSQAYYRPQFGSFGARSWIEKPMLLSNTRHIEIGARCRLREGLRMESTTRPGAAPGRIVLHDGVTIEQGAHIVSSNLVEFEDDVCLAAFCVVVDTSHLAGDSGDGNRVDALDPAPSFVRLRRRVFLGAHVVVLPGVEIGENTVVGAGSVVTTSLPADVIAAGAPARIIRQI